MVCWMFIMGGNLFGSFLGNILENLVKSFWLGGIDEWDFKE